MICSVGDAILYILVIILIALSAFFSATETAFSSVNRIRLKNYAGEGNKRAAKTLKIAEDFDRALSAILIGNNIVNIASASIGTLIFSKLMGDGPAAVTASTVVMTVMVLIFGEVLPKSMAKENAERFSLSVTPVLSAIIFILTPFTAMLVGLKKLVTRWFHNDRKDPSVTEEELKYIIEEIEDEGVLEEQESELVQSALDFDEITVGEILTPRVDVVALNIDDSPDKILSVFQNDNHSRLPVYEKSIDSIIGILNARTFYNAYLKNNHPDIRTLIQDTVFVPPTKKISVLLKELQHEKLQLAVVVDQYGGTIGIITVEDILEELVGEIWDENEDAVEDILPIGENQFEVNGDMNVYDMLEELELDYPQFKSSSNSVSGWAFEMFEHIPEIGESFTYENLAVTVKELEEQRITKLLVTVSPQTDADN